MRGFIISAPYSNRLIHRTGPHFLQQTHAVAFGRAKEHHGSSFLKGGDENHANSSGMGARQFAPTQGDSEPCLRFSKLPYFDADNGLWLSLVERLVRDQEAVGSNPTSPINYTGRPHV